MIRLLDTPISRLQFIVRFAEVDLEKLEAEEWRRLRDEIAAFTSVDDRLQPLDQRLSGGQTFDRRSGKPHEETKATIASLQADVRGIIHGIVDVRELFREKHTEVTLPQISLTGSYYVRPSNPPFMNRNELCMLGTERDVFLFALLSMLSNEPTDRLQRCPECQRTFVRLGKQLYCCRKCVNRVNARAWRQTPEGKRKNRARVAASYEKRQKAKYPGRKVKIMKRKGGN